MSVRCLCTCYSTKVSLKISKSISIRQCLSSTDSMMSVTKTDFKIKFDTPTSSLGSCITVKFNP